MSLAYPDDSVQTLTSAWWVDDKADSLVRGRLLWTWVPYPEMKPYRLIPEGRGDAPRQHFRARSGLKRSVSATRPKALPRSLSPLFPCVTARAIWSNAASGALRSSLGRAASRSPKTLVEVTNAGNRRDPFLWRRTTGLNRVLPAEGLCL